MKSFKQLLETLLRSKTYGELLRQTGHTPAQVQAGEELRTERIKNLKKSLKQSKNLRKRSASGRVTSIEKRLKQILQRFEDPGLRSEFAAPPDTNKPGEQSRLEKALKLTTAATKRKAKEAEENEQSEKDSIEMGYSHALDPTFLAQRRKSRRERAKQLGRLDYDE